MQKSSRRDTRVRREVNRALLLRALRMIEDDLIRDPALCASTRASVQQNTKKGVPASAGTPYNWLVAGAGFEPTTFGL